MYVSAGRLHRLPADGLSRQADEGPVWPMHRLSAGTFQTMGNAVYARSRTPRRKQLHHANVRRKKPPTRRLRERRNLPKIHEKTTQTQGQRSLFPLWGIWRQT